MKNNTLFKKVNCLIAFSLCLLNLGNTVVSEPSQIDSLWGNGKSATALIFIIEFRDILCSPCCGSFLDFCLSLPLEFQRENTWGIVVFDPGSQTDLDEKIIAKKVRGFMNGNSLHFPVFFDFSQIFKTLRSQATQLLLLDPASLTVRTYDFPLTGKQKNAILRAVLERF
jgi:hypothetical protein